MFLFLSKLRKSNRASVVAGSLKKKFLLEAVTKGLNIIIYIYISYRVMSLKFSMWIDGACDWISMSCISDTVFIIVRCLPISTVSNAVIFRLCRTHPVITTFKMLTDKNLHALLTPWIIVWNLFFLTHSTVYTSTSVFWRDWGVALVLFVRDTSKFLFSSFVASAFENT